MQGLCTSMGPEAPPPGNTPTESPLETASQLSKMFFLWLSPLMREGSRRPLEDRDIPPVPRANGSAATADALRVQWEREVANAAASGRQPSLAWSIQRSFSRHQFISIVLFGGYLLLTFVQPYLVSKILQYVNDGSVDFMGTKSGILAAICLGLSSVIGVMLFNSAFYNMQMFGIKTRTSVIATLFSKSMSITNTARKKYTTGEIITLMSVDTERLWLGFLLSNWLWMGPIMITVSMILLFVEIGYPALIVTFALLAWGVFQEKMSGWIGRTRRTFVSFTSERTKLMNEILQGIRVVKLYAWEDASRARIAAVRSDERRKLSRYLFLRMVNSILTFLGPPVIAYILFMSYSALGGELNVQKVYTCLAILNITRLPIALFPMARAAAIEATTSLERVRKYLLLPELRRQCAISVTGGDLGSDDVSPGGTNSSDKSIELTTVPQTQNSDVLVSIRGGYFNWIENDDDEVKVPGMPPAQRRDDYLSVSIREDAPASEENKTEHAADPSADKLARCTLKNIDLTINRGDLVAIVGSVGAGKTSLVMSMLGQTTLVQGSHVLNARVAYAGQEHWIQNLSVRDNILFDSTMNESMYEMVMDAAQLSKDLLMLPNADLTEIGERGINLSGGQKARVNVARTLYAPNAELYVFDDPLAAVDVHVGKALFKSVFMDLLGKETRVIVFSSNYHFLPYFSKIVVVEKDGFVHVCESYGDLKARFPQYASADGEAAFEDHDQEENEGNAPSPVTDSGPQLDGQDASASASSELSGNKPCLAEEETKDSEENNCKSNLSNRQRDAHMYRSIRDITQLSSSTNNITKTVTKEDRETGEVSAATYGRYFSAALGEGNSNGGMFVIVVLALAFAIGQVFRVYSDLWVGMWGGDEFSQPVSFYYIVYSGLTFGTIMFAVLRAYYFIVRCLNASRNLHDSLLKCVLAAPVNTYFDVTPVGRILNRFSKDLDSIDCNLPDFFLNMLQNGFHVFSAVVMCVVSTPFFLIVMLPLAIMFYFVQSYYRKSSRELKRLESIARSPMYTLFGELLVGLSTVRAFAREEAFIKKFHSVQDYQNKFFVTFWVSSRWLALRLDLLSSGCVVSVALIAVLMKMYGGHVNSNLLGVALVFSLQLAGLLQWAVRSVIETENNMTSVERLLAFRSIEPEGHHYSPDDSVVPQDWPSEGSITMRNVTLCYRPGLPRVLDGVDFSIPGGSKVGVCGRTGAGKSSLMAALFRVAEALSGSEITIDGVDIQRISLNLLRSRLTIIPQDPVLFSGTLRYNLDPFDRYSDEEIWQALEQAHLKEDIISKFPKKLDHEVSERGENISVGQRQLLCIARALLRKSKVIVMDEATASVDSFTDRRIQDTIRSSFRNCTVLTIAHRLETVADYDYVLVMDAGKVVEFDSPAALLRRPEGVFAALVGGLGADARAAVEEAAARRHRERKEGREI